MIRFRTITFYTIYKRLIGQPDSLKFKLYADDGKLIVELGTDQNDDDMQFDMNNSRQM